MLTRIQLTNFKSWADTGAVKLRPITGFFGTNSSGKTSLLQSLLLLKQTSESSDRGLVFHFGDKTTPVDLGDFSSVVHAHDEKAKMTLALKWKVEEPFKVFDIVKSGKSTLFESSSLGFSVTAARAAARAQRIQVEEMTYRVGKDARFGMRRKKPAGKSADYELFAEDSDFSFIRSVGRPWPLPHPVKSYGFPDQVRAYHQNAGFLADLELELEECMRNVYYLGPLRAYPERQYTWAGAQPTDMGGAGSSVIAAILASGERGKTISLGRGRRKVTLEEYVAGWLRKLGLIHEFRIDPLGEGSQSFQVKVRKTENAPEVLLTDVGFGVSQILPVLVLCFYVPEWSTVILEQPEIHLHPAVQSGLADVLIDAWKKRKVQILLESHSEHLLRRLQRRVAEEDVKNEEIGLYFCQAKEGRSEITELNLDMFGAVSNWPEDFFGDEMGEIAATSKAAIRRRRAAP